MNKFRMDLAPLPHRTHKHLSQIVRRDGKVLGFYRLTRLIRKCPPFGLAKPPIFTRMSLSECPPQSDGSIVASGNCPRGRLLPHRWMRVSALSGSSHSGGRWPRNVSERAADVWHGLFMSPGDVGSQVVSRDCSEGRLESPLSPGGAAVAGGMSGFGSSDSPGLSRNGPTPGTAPPH